MVPSLIVISLGLDPTRTLVISQVVLSFGLPFAIIPSGHVHQPKRGDGSIGQPPCHYGNHRCFVAILIIVLNVYLICQVFIAG